MKGIASMKEAYIRSLLKRVASSAWDSQAEFKHYFCPLVVKKVGLQSSGCLVCSERVMLALITQQLHVLTLSWIDVVWTWTLSFMGREKFEELTSASGAFHRCGTDVSVSPEWAGQEAVAASMLCSPLQMLTSGQSSCSAWTYTLKTIFQPPALGGSSYPRISSGSCTDTALSPEIWTIQQMRSS